MKLIHRQYSPVFIRYFQLSIANVPNLLIPPHGNLHNTKLCHCVSTRVNRKRKRGYEIDLTTLNCARPSLGASPTSPMSYSRTSGGKQSQEVSYFRRPLLNILQCGLIRLARVPAKTHREVCTTGSAQKHSNGTARDDRCVSLGHRAQPALHHVDRIHIDPKVLPEAMIRHWRTRRHRINQLKRPSLPPQHNPRFDYFPLTLSVSFAATPHSGDRTDSAPSHPLHPCTDRKNTSMTFPVFRPSGRLNPSAQSANRSPNATGILG